MVMRTMIRMWGITNPLMKGDEDQNAKRREEEEEKGAVTAES